MRDLAALLAARLLAAAAFLLASTSSADSVGILLKQGERLRLRRRRRRSSDSSESESESSVDLHQRRIKAQLICGLVAILHRIHYLPAHAEGAQGELLQGIRCPGPAHQQTKANARQQQHLPHELHLFQLCSPRVVAIHFMWHFSRF
ncbi:hypothetical protein ACLKA6_013358 [Drosophila palustris]